MSLGPRAAAVIEFAELDPRHGAVVLDDAGFGDRRQDLGDAAHDMRVPVHRRQLLLGMGTILKRDDGGVGADQRAVQERAFPT